MSMRRAAALILSATVCSVAAAQTTTWHIIDLGPSEVLALNSHDVAAGDAGGHAAAWVNGAWHEKRVHGHLSKAFGIDDAGNMMGVDYTRSEAGTYQYFPRGARLVPIPLPHGSVHAVQTLSPQFTTGMSPDGHWITGTYGDVEDGQRCFTWHPGDAVAAEIVVPPDYYSCTASSVNDAGEVVGQLWSIDTEFQAFTWRDGVFTFVGPNGFDGGQLYSVNAAGHAAGTHALGQAWYWDGTTLTGVPSQSGMTMLEGVSINNHDEILGWGFDGSNLSVLLLSAGVMTDIAQHVDDLGDWNFNLSYPSAISDDGIIVGSAYRGDGMLHGFRIVPLAN